MRMKWIEEKEKERGLREKKKDGEKESRKGERERAKMGKEKERETEDEIDFISLTYMSSFKMMINILSIKQIIYSDTVRKH